MPHGGPCTELPFLGPPLHSTGGPSTRRSSHPAHTHPKLLASYDALLSLARPSQTVRVAGAPVIQRPHVARVVHAAHLVHEAVQQRLL